MKGDFTKAKEITRETKKKVWERQGGRSLLSNQSITVDMCCCHVIGRGCSGVGYEWNIIGLTPEEHRLLDESKPVGRWTNQQAKTIIKNHLIVHYDGWNEKVCKYHKGWKEADYEVTYCDKR